MELNIQLFANLNVGDTYETSAVNIKPYGYSSNAYQMKSSIKLNSQNLSNFTSNVTIKSYMRTLNNSWGWSGFSKNYMERYTKANEEAGYTFKNNTQLTSLPTNNANNWVECGSWSGDISHRADGTCTLYIKSHLNTTNSSSYSYIPRDTEQESEALVLHALHKQPEINITGITELNSYLGVANNVFVQNLSKKQFAFTNTLYDSATVQGITIANGSTNATGTTTPITLDFSYKNIYTVANTIPIKATISDSYGSIGTQDINYTTTPIMYNKPTINTSTSVKRNGQLSGKALLNLYATFYNHTIGNTANTITVKYRFWEKGTTEPSSWNDINNPTISGDNITVSNYEIGSTDTSASNYFNFQKAYNVKIYIQDAMRDADGNYISDTITKTIPVGEDVWGEYKDRLRIKKAEVPSGIYSYEEGNVSTQMPNGALVIKKASQSGDSTPNNGVVLEYGIYNGWGGQLYIGDNASEGIWYNGWNNGVRGTWRKLQFEPVVLYSNDSGSNGNIALSDSVANYSYIEILYYIDANGTSIYGGDTKLYNINGKLFDLNIIEAGASSTWIKRARYTASGTSLTLVQSGYAGFNPSTQTGYTTNYVYITRVLGYY